ncbi:MAG: SDR family oxidoreductase [Bacillota bacterium]|nr:SDR family oxidoreductase [Bacillota bacterium]
MKPLKIKELKSVYDMISLKDKVALITGGAGGIGRSCAAGMAEVGASVVLMDIPQKEEILAENCRAISERYGTKAIYLTGDVSDETSVTGLYDAITEKLGTVDVVFSNAGIAYDEDNAPSLSLEDWQKMVDVNLTGMFLIDRIGANLMKAHSHGGSIINTASMSGHIINRMTRDMMDRHMCAYASTKSGVVHLTKSVAANYVEAGIRCNSISPGLILSGLHDHMDMSVLEKICSHVPMNRFASLDEIIGIVVYLASDLSSYVTGSDFIIDGGYTIW